MPRSDKLSGMDSLILGGSVPLLGIDWGPLSSWFAAVATVLAATVALLGGFRVFDRLRAPRLIISFQQREPWCRKTRLQSGDEGYWVRLGVENVGKEPARSCIGKLAGVTSEGNLRGDIDPIQLRWAGVPRRIAFQSLDIRRGQREFLNILLRVGHRLMITTHEEPDFDPGFSTELPCEGVHLIEVAFFADNASTVSETVWIRCAKATEGIALDVRLNGSQSPEL